MFNLKESPTLFWSGSVAFVIAFEQCVQRKWDVGTRPFRRGDCRTQTFGRKTKIDAHYTSPFRFHIVQSDGHMQLIDIIK